MSDATATTELSIRSFRDEDEARVLELLEAALGGGPAGVRTPEFFRWKHLANPFGRSYMLVAEADGRIVGLRAFMRWRFHAGERTIRAVRAVDTATHPNHQGRGVFSTLTRRALQELASEVDLVFNTPNDKSMPGYLKMGWQVVGRIPVGVRVRRPVRFLLHARARHVSESPSRDRPQVDAAPAGSVIEDERIAPLLEEVEAPDGAIVTPRTFEYLRWRYASAPQLDYRAAIAEEGGRVSGLAVFRVRSRGRLWESMVTDLIVRPGDEATARRLLRDVRDAARADHLTCVFPPASSAWRAARASGFLSSRRGMTFVVNPLVPLTPDPASLASWGLSLGDLEVF